MEDSGLLGVSINKAVNALENSSFRVLVRFMSMLKNKRKIDVNDNDNNVEVMSEKNYKLNPVRKNCSTFVFSSVR